MKYIFPCIIVNYCILILLIVTAYSLNKCTHTLIMCISFITIANAPFHNVMLFDNTLQVAHMSLIDVIVTRIGFDISSMCSSSNMEKVTAFGKNIFVIIASAAGHYLIRLMI